jgi:hypothetical protein
LLPQSILLRASERVDLWGASGSTVSTLFEGLAGSWTIDGGPPLALPFAYINGILQPFILNLHKGPISLSMVVLFLLLLLLGRSRDRKSVVVLSVLCATWALAAEAEFALFAIGLVMAAALYAWRKGMRSAMQSIELSNALLAYLIGAAISLFQGGTITEMAKGLLGMRPAGPLGGGTGLGGFQFRWPPAIVSAHLGELHITNPYELLVGILEIGPAILAGALIIMFIGRWIRKGRFAEGALALV